MNSYDKHITNEQLIFEYLEGNLRPEEKKLVDHKIQKDSEFKLQFEIWQATYVKEPLPLFSKKADLYKPIPKGFGKRNAAISIAVILSIGIIGFFTFEQKDKQTQNLIIESVNNQTEYPVANNITPDEVSPKKNITLATSTQLYSEIIEYKPDLLSAEPLPEARLDMFINLTVNPDLAIIATFSPDSTNQKQDSVRIKNASKKTTKKIKKHPKRTTWKDIKRAWYNEPTVVPMD